MGNGKAWFPLYVGDYLADTREFTTEEHGAYLLLLMHYWCNGPLPADDARLRNICGLSKHKFSKMKPLFSKKFELRGDKYFNRRMDEELSKAADITEKRTEAARARWDANAHANAKPLHTQPQSQLPFLKEKNTSKPLASPCPHLEIINLYHEILPDRPQVIPARWKGSASEAHLRSRWRENPEHQSLDWWRGFFEAVRGNDWWMGRSKWKGVDLHWLLKRTNFDKVIEHWANAA